MIAKAIEFYESQEREVFWRLLTPIQKRILYCLRYRDGTRTTDFKVFSGTKIRKIVALPKSAIANYALINPNFLGTNFSDFLKHCVIVADTELVSGQTLYYLSDSDLDLYIQGLTTSDVFNRAELSNSITSEVNKLVNQRLDALAQQRLIADNYDILVSQITKETRDLLDQHIKV